MKTTIKLFALLAALCLLAGCASGAGQTETRQEPSFVKGGAVEI